MFSNDAISSIAQQYVAEMGKAIANDDWDDQRFLRECIRRDAATLRQVERAVDLFNRLGLRVG